MIDARSNPSPMTSEPKWACTAITCVPEHCHVIQPRRLMLAEMQLSNRGSLTPGGQGR